MNTTLSQAACAALQRIRTLRALTTKTGLQTTREQFDVLLKLEDKDCLAVADALSEKAGQR